MHMDLQLEDLEASATEDQLAAEEAAAQTQSVKSFECKRPSRKPSPEHLPRERVVIAASESSPCCGSFAPTKPRGVAWKGVGAWVIFSHSRHANFRAPSGSRPPARNHF